MFKVLEHFIKGKLDEKHLEDGLIIAPPFAAVIDGSTSKGDYTWGEKTSGQIARDVIASAFKIVPSDISFDSMMRIITKLLNDQTYIYTGKDADKLKAFNRLTATAVIYTDTYKEVWQIGDCQLMADGVIYENSKPQEMLLATRRADVLERAIKSGINIAKLEENDIGRAAILNDLRDLCTLQNKAFAVADGTEMYLPGVKRINVSGCKEIVLASDGYPFLHPTLKDSEEALEYQLKTDPLCIHKFKATKGLCPGYNSFDDRSYLRISL